MDVTVHNTNFHHAILRALAHIVKKLPSNLFPPPSHDHHQQIKYKEANTLDINSQSDRETMQTILKSVPLTNVTFITNFKDPQIKASHMAWRPVSQNILPEMSPWIPGCDVEKQQELPLGNVHYLFYFISIEGITSYARFTSRNHHNLTFRALQLGFLYRQVVSFSNGLSSQQYNVRRDLQIILQEDSVLPSKFTCQIWVAH